VRVPHAVENPALREELLALASEDERVRSALAAEGSLLRGYHARMERVHTRNAQRLSSILDAHGWPGRGLVGSDGARAAWLIAHHAIGEPRLQRRALQLLRTAAVAGEATLLEVAMLEDRVRISEGRPQRYGTLFDWDRNGEMNPLPIENADCVDERRRAIGLGPLAADTRRRREWVRGIGEQPPADWHVRQSEIEAWYRSRGWRD
jgi:hypothetical protein